jgi:hypothetical protein
MHLAKAWRKQLPPLLTSLGLINPRWTHHRDQGHQDSVKSRQ